MVIVAESTQYFVTDGITPTANLVGIYGLISLAAQQYNLVTYRNVFNGADISHAHVHADPTSDRCPSPLDQNFSFI